MINSPLLASQTNFGGPGQRGAAQSKYLRKQYAGSDLGLA